MKINSKNAEQNYIELTAIKRITTYESIARYKVITIYDAKKKYKSIKLFIANELNMEIHDYEEFIKQPKILQKKNEIDRIFKNQFSGHKNRAEGFGSFEIFYSQWYVHQDNRCFYCKTTKEELEELFNPQNGIDAKIKSTKFNATLHIEQIDPKKGYSKDNCRLACSLCNNTKSDLISQENYLKYFAPSITKFLSDLKNTNLENITY
jgi:hypothetical protein